MPNYYIFIKGDSFLKCGKSVSAYEATVTLLDINIWPLHKGTANRKNIKKGDLVIFYVSGQKYGAKEFLAKAKVDEAVDWNKMHYDITPLYTDNIPYTAVTFSNIEIFDNPPKIRTMLDNLSFIPNSKYWGVTLMSGTKKISECDFQLVACMQDEI